MNGLSKDQLAVAAKFGLCTFTVLFACLFVCLKCNSLQRSRCKKKWSNSTTAEIYISITLSDREKQQVYAGVRLQTQPVASGGFFPSWRSHKWSHDWMKIPPSHLCSKPLRTFEHKLLHAGDTLSGYLRQQSILPNKPAAPGAMGVDPFNNTWLGCV